MFATSEDHILVWPKEVEATSADAAFLDRLTFVLEERHHKPSLSASTGTASEAGGIVTWAMDVAAGGSETVSFDVTVDADAPVVPMAHATHPSLSIRPQPSVAIYVFPAPDYYYTNESVVGIPDTECGTTIASEIEVADEFELVSMKVGMNVYHPWRGDLRIQLSKPQGTTVRLFQRVNQVNRWIHLGALFSDAGPANAFRVGHHLVEAPFYDVEGQTQGENVGTLSTFVGENTQGRWTLSVCDEAPADVGSLRRWALFFYTDVMQHVRAEVYVARFAGDTFTASRKVLLVK